MAQYRVAADFVAESAGELSLKSGDVVVAVSRDVQNGWMEVKKAATPNVIGYVPASYLQPLEGASEPRKSPNASVAVNRGNGHVRRSNPFEQYEVSHPEKFKETLEFWRERERRFMAGEEEKLPEAKRRVYFYWDKSGVRHGPFFEDAMRQKLELQEVTSQTPISLVTEDEQPLEQKAIREYFPSIDKAFVSVPVIKDDRLWWCYRDDMRYVQGPYSAEQMYKWFQEGYFNAETLVRTSTQSDDQFVPLGTLFPDGAGAFLTPGLAPPSVEAPRVQAPYLQNPVPVHPPTARPSLAAAPMGTSLEFRLDSQPLEQSIESKNSRPYANSLGFDANASTRSFNPFDDALEDKGGWAIDQTPNAGRNGVPNNGWSDVLLPPPQTFSAVPVDEFDPLVQNHSGNAMDHGKKLFVRAMSHEEEETIDLSPRSNAPVGEGDDPFLLDSQATEEALNAQNQESSKPSTKVAKWEMVVHKHLQSIDQIYTFLTRPVPKDLGVLRCKIIRSISGGLHMNYNMYQLYLEKDNQAVGHELLRAVKHKRLTLDSYYDVQLGAVARRDMNKAIGQLVENFSGTHFMLHNNVPSHRGPPRDLCVITYLSDKRKEKGPRVMQVGIPAFKKGSSTELQPWSHNGSIKRAEMLHALTALDFEKLQVFKNKPPKFNRKLHAYTLNFHGRATK